MRVLVGRVARFGREEKWIKLGQSSHELGVAGSSKSDNDDRTHTWHPPCPRRRRTIRCPTARSLSTRWRR